MMLSVIIKVFDPTGYENVLYAMIFVPLSIIFLICLLVTMLVVFSRKRFVFQCTVVIQVEHSYRFITVYNCIKQKIM